MNEMILTGTEIATRTIKREMFERWISYVDGTPKTVKTYEWAIKQFMEYLNDRNIKTPTREDVIAYRDYLKADHKPTTVQIYLAAVKLFFRWLAYEGLYSNITERVKNVKLSGEHKKDSLTAEQANELLKSVDRTTLKGKRDYAMLALMTTTGIRTISVILANIDDIRTKGNEVVLWYKGKGHTDKDAFVKIPATVEKAIREYLQARGERNGKAALFASTANRNSNGRMTTKSVSRVVKEQLRAIGLDSDRLTAHSLRHTAATFMLMNGTAVEEAQEILGHRDITTTMIYNHSINRNNNMGEYRAAAMIPELA